MGLASKILKTSNLPDCSQKLKPDLDRPDNLTRSDKTVKVRSLGRQAVDSSSSFLCRYSFIIKNAGGKMGRFLSCGSLLWMRVLEVLHKRGGLTAFRGFTPPAVFL